MKRILWMADEIIAQTHPKDWGRVLDASKELFSIIGNKELNHEIVVPQDCIGELASHAIGERFTTVIDLTGGWLSSSLRNIFPSTPLITDFHLSRVRDVSDPELHTTGHIVSLNKAEIQTRSQQFNLSRPLIVDDVSFSGLSSEVTMQLFGLNSEQTTHGFLIVNDGNLGPSPGARRRLESTGGRVVAGFSMNTSEGDDGWHIKDFIAHPQLERMLGASIIVQELFEQDGKDSHVAQRLFENMAMRQIFFPKAVGRDTLKVMEKEGSFIPNRNHEPKEGSIHTTNPTLLISPYVLEHISSKQFRENFDKVAHLMLEMRSLSFDQEASREASIGLRKEVEGRLFTENKERHI